MATGTSETGFPEGAGQRVGTPQTASEVTGDGGDKRSPCAACLAPRGHYSTTYKRAGIYTLGRYSSGWGCDSTGSRLGGLECVRWLPHRLGSSDLSRLSRWPGWRWGPIALLRLVSQAEAIFALAFPGLTGKDCSVRLRQCAPKACLDWRPPAGEIGSHSPATHRRYTPF